MYLGLQHDAMLRQCGFSKELFNQITSSYNVYLVLLFLLYGKYITKDLMGSIRSVNISLQTKKHFKVNQFESLCNR